MPKPSVRWLCTKGTNTIFVSSQQVVGKPATTESVYGLPRAELFCVGVTKCISVDIKFCTSTSMECAPQFSSQDCYAGYQFLQQNCFIGICIFVWTSCIINFWNLCMCSFDCKPNFFELKYFRHDVSPPSVHLYFSSKSLGKIVRAVKKALVFVPNYCGCLSFFVCVGVFFLHFFKSQCWV